MLLNGKVFFSALLFLYIVHGLNIDFLLFGLSLCNKRYINMLLLLK